MDLLAALQAAEPGRGWHVRGGAWAFPVATEPPVVFAPYLVAHEQGETGRAVCGPMLAYCGALAGAMMAAQDVDDLEVRMALVDVVARVDGSHPVLPLGLPPDVDALGVHMENPDMLLTLVRRIGARVRECTGGLDMRDDALRALPAFYTMVLNIAGRRTSARHAHWRYCGRCSRRVAGCFSVAGDGTGRVLRRVRPPRSLTPGFAQRRTRGSGPTCDGLRGRRCRPRPRPLCKGPAAQTLNSTNRTGCFLALGHVCPTLHTIFRNIAI